MRGAVVAVAVVVSLALAGCGSRDTAGVTGSPSSPAAVASSSSSSTSAAASRSGSHPAAHLAACRRVWRVGRSLPAHYRGCRSATGETVPAQSRPCSVGNRLVQFHRFYAVPGHPIRRAHPSRLRDPAYQQVLAVCTG